MSEKIHDKGYKRILAQKKNFLSFLQTFVQAEWVSEITEESLTLIDKEFIPKDFKEREADIIYSVKLNGKEVIFYCLLELQSSVDYTMPFRLLIYMTELWRRLFADADKNVREQENYKLPAIVPIILYNGRDEWTAVRSFKEYQDGHERFKDNVVNFEYIFLNVNKYKDETLQAIGNFISSVFLLDKQQNTDQLIANAAFAAKIFTNLTESEQIDFTDWLKDVLLKKVKNSEKDIVAEAITNFKKGDVNTMTYAIERLFDDVYEEAVEKTRLEMTKENEAVIKGIAKAMLAGNYPSDEISRLTGLSMSAINDLRN